MLCFVRWRAICNQSFRSRNANKRDTREKYFFAVLVLIGTPSEKRYCSSVLQKSAMLYMYIMSCKTCYNQRTWRSLPGRASRIDRYAHFFFARKGSFYPFILSFRHLTGRPGVLECAWRMAYRRTMPYWWLMYYYYNHQAGRGSLRARSEAQASRNHPLILIVNNNMGI